MSVEEARSLLGKRGLRRLACDLSCCVRDRDATVRDSRRHFIVTRTAELAGMSGVPIPDRPEYYLTNMLSPARDLAAQIARSVPQASKHRDRLDDWYLALKHTREDDLASKPSSSLVPTGHRMSAGA